MKIIVIIIIQDLMNIFEINCYCKLVIIVNDNIYNHDKLYISKINEN